VTTLPESEQRYLDAATGWLELGNFNEAFVEVDRIQSVLRAHPEILGASM